MSLLNDSELAEQIEQCKAPRVSKEYIQSRIKGATFTRFSPTVTICELTLDNGYSVRGESACVSLENYDEKIGERIAYDTAFQKLWPLFGFLLAENIFINPTYGGLYGKE